MKIGRGQDGENVPAFERDGYELHQFTNGSSCVLVRCTSDPIGLLRHLVSKSSGEIALLYVLLLSRKEQHPVGRHQSPYVTPAEAVEFLQRFGAFLKGDGRHELWLHCPEQFEVVYDRHERIWIYGPIDQTMAWVQEFEIPSEPLEALPLPHTHHYHPEFDAAEDDVMNYWEWRTTPLQDRDGE